MGSIDFLFSFFAEVCFFQLCWASVLGLSLYKACRKSTGKKNPCNNLAKKPKELTPVVVVKSKRRNRRTVVQFSLPLFALAVTSGRSSQLLMVLLILNYDKSIDEFFAPAIDRSDAPAVAAD